MRNLWLRFRPGFERLLYEVRVFGWRRGAAHWLRELAMRYRTPTANFGPTRRWHG